MERCKMVERNIIRKCIAGDADSNAILSIAKQHTWMIKQWKWKVNHNGYVVRRTSTRVNGRVVGKQVFLHHEVLGWKTKDYTKTEDPLTVDHLDGNPLNNHPSNLEIVPLSMNKKRAVFRMFQQNLLRR